MPNFCPHCGANLTAPDARFCTSCGKPIASAAVLPVPAAATRDLRPTKTPAPRRRGALWLVLGLILLTATGLGAGYFYLLRYDPALLAGFEAQLGLAPPPSQQPAPENTATPTGTLTTAQIHAKEAERLLNAGEVKQADTRIKEAEALEPENAQIKAIRTKLRETEATALARTSANADAVAEIDAVLNGCAAVSRSSARFVVIPTALTGKKTDFVLRFKGTIGPGIAVARHEMLREGLGKGALKIDVTPYTVTIVPDTGGAPLGTYRGHGIGHFDIAAGAGNVQITIASEKAGQGKSGTGSTVSLDGRCNLMNLVLVGGGN